MKKLTLILMLLINITTYSQKKESIENTYTNEIEKQANDMGVVFIKEDYKSFVKFLYPKFIEAIGGENKMIQMLEKTFSQTKSQGVSFLNVTFDKPTKIIKNNKELQCTIVQHLTAKTEKGVFMNSSTLIAISLDDGKKWYFIDTTNKDISQIRKLLPNLSSEIIIPKKI